MGGQALIITTYNREDPYLLMTITAVITHYNLQ